MKEWVRGRTEANENGWKHQANEWTRHARTKCEILQDGGSSFFFWPCISVLSRSSLSPQMIFHHFLPFAIFHHHERIRGFLHLSIARRIIYVNLSSLNIPQELWSKPVSLRNQPEANVTCPSSFFSYFRLACYRLYFRVFIRVLTLTPATSNRINTTNVMLLLYTRLVIIGGSNDRAKVMTRLILSRVSRPVRETAMFISVVLQNHSRIVFVFMRFAIDKTQKQLRFFLQLALTYSLS